MPLTPQEMRALYPITNRYAYLDHAAIAPLSTPVRSTMEVFLGRLTEEPFDLAHWERLRGQVRVRVAELLAVGPESIAFTKNTTSGLGLVAAGLDWEAGDNSVGVGFAYVGPRMLERLNPVTIGTDSVVRDEEYFQYDLTLKPGARRFEEAAPNYPGILGMGAAVNLLLRAGSRAVEEVVLRLADRLRDELPRRGYGLVLKPPLPSERSGIVAFRRPRMVPAALRTRSREAGGIVSL